MFKENFTRLCAKKGESPTSVCQKIGLSNSMYSEWTDSSVPRRTTLIKLSNYLGCTVDDLLACNESNEMNDMFWEVFVSICKSNHKTPSEVLGELHIAGDSATKWKNGSTPSVDSIIRIADYFDVSVDYLLGREAHDEQTDMANSQSLGSLQNGLHRLIREPDRLTLSDIERDVILSLRRQPDMMTPICRLLGIPEPADKAAES